jgi:RNA recognition motif-containing protein
MKRKMSHRRRGDSDSDSSSSEYDDSSERPEELFKGLKSALVEKSNSVYRYIYKIEKNYKESVGILRISIPDSFSFSQSDMEEFFKKFGKIERIVLKQNVDRTNVSEDQPRNKEAESLSYVIYSEYCSAILAMKVLNSIS